ncbi:MAG: GNAT family N-acetyltransferase [Pseudomonadota bacterium]
MTVVTTERLTLRPFAPEDEPAYAAIRARPEVARYLAGGEAGAAQATETARRLIPAFVTLWTDPDGPGYGPWAVEERATGRLLGHLGLRRLDDLGGETELLYAFDPPAQGRGFATEGARAALAYGFETLRLSRIIALALPENAASLRVMERIGMTRAPGLTEAFGLQVVRSEIDETAWRRSGT